jgi:hypothetical protein
VVGKELYRAARRGRFTRFPLFSHRNLRR